MAKLVESYCGGILSLVFPGPCACCGRYIKNHEFIYVCPECYENERRIAGGRCEKCNRPISANAGPECRDCRENKKAFAYVRDSGVYEGALKELIHGLKFYNKKKIAGILAERVALRLREEIFEGADMIIPVPASELSERGREFNHTEIITKKIAEKKSIKFFNAVKKIKKTLPQNKLDRKQRLKNLKGAFKASPEVEGKTVIVFDDVYTTGATMNEMAKTLITAGAKEVRGVVAAKSL